jgi:hypothetical protein
MAKDKAEAQKIEIVHVPAELQESCEVSVSTKGVYTWSIKTRTPEEAKKLDSKLRELFGAPIKTVE